MFARGRLRKPKKPTNRWSPRAIALTVPSMAAQELMTASSFPLPYGMKMSFALDGRPSPIWARSIWNERQRQGQPPCHKQNTIWRTSRFIAGSVLTATATDAVRKWSTRGTRTWITPTTALYATRICLSSRHSGGKRKKQQPTYSLTSKTKKNGKLGKHKLPHWGQQEWFTK